MFIPVYEKPYFDKERLFTILNITLYLVGYCDEK